jgi:signal transduction histidine kinase
VLSAVIATTFALLLSAISSLNNAVDEARNTQRVLSATDQLELLIVNVETGLRGYIITGEPQFLQPLQAGQAALPGEARALERSAAASSPAQGARARQISTDASSYVNNFVVPLVATARHNPAAAESTLEAAQGKQRIDTIRNQFATLEASEQHLLATQQASASSASKRAVVTAVAAIPLSVLFILLAGGYFILRVGRPIRQAAVLAGQVAEGDLSVWMRENIPGEVGELARALNVMTRSLRASRDELERSAAEQAALRRVATLVAAGAPQSRVFHAVAAETGLVLRAGRAAVIRYEADRSATVVGTWGEPSGPGPDLGSRWSVAENSNLGLILDTHEPARVTSYQDVPGELSAWARQQGVRWSVGAPIMVEGGTWGVALGFSGNPVPPADDAEQRLLGFTELTAMAIANTESRVKLITSRARVVAAADEARRRIERDLHDGAQQRLITLALELRTAAARLPPDQDWIADEWAHATRELGDVTDELRELSRGLHPVTLEKGGLRPALRALARRSGVRAEVRVDIDERLPERVEVAGYYVVSEALTNVAKHAGPAAVRIEASVVDGALRLTVSDNGTGGADPAHGSGLIGLSDRVEALGGRIQVSSPPGGGTSLEATIPVPAALIPDAAAEPGHRPTTEPLMPSG